MMPNPFRTPDTTALVILLMLSLNAQPLAARTPPKTRVDPLHARKFAARLQAANASANSILLRIETKAGHGAGLPAAKLIEEASGI